jgi:DNA modification methylase
MSILMQTINFTAALLRKTGQVASDQWDRKPEPPNLNPDPELVDTIEDPIKLLSIQNSVLSPSLMPNRKPWRGACEKSNVFFQILIEACSSEGSIIIDLTASTGASLRACRTSGRHFFGLEKDPKIYDALLKPLLKSEDQTPVSKRKKQRIPTGTI